MMSWCKKGGYSAEISPKSELCWFKWAKTHKKCVQDSMLLANLSPNPCLMWLHYNWYRIKIRSQINVVPTPTVAWTRGWLLQRGGGGVHLQNCFRVEWPVHVRCAATDQCSALVPGPLSSRGPAERLCVSGGGGAGRAACRSSHADARPDLRGAVP